MRGAASLLATVSLAVSGVVAVTTTSATADPDPAPSFAQCPDAFPQSDLTPGLEGTGLTVTGRYAGGVNGPDAGTAPQEFKATYIDTLGGSDDPELYIFDLEGLNITKPDGSVDAGAWDGISGSPIYAPDGRLIGSASYGFINGTTNRVGVTPADRLYAARDRAVGDLPPVVTLSKKQQASIEAKGGKAAGTASPATLRRLAPPTVLGSVRNVDDTVLARFAKRSHLANPVLGGGSAAAEEAPSSIVAGGNVGFGISYGSVPLYSVGTATAVCGNTVVAYGHPDYLEPYQRTMHTATAVSIEKSALGSFKLANLGAPVGTLLHDGNDAVIGQVGDLPTSTEVVTSTTGRVPTTSTTHVVEPDALSYVASVQVYRDIINAFDSDRGGEALTTWTIDYTVDGKPGKLTRTNRFTSKTYLAEQVPGEIGQAIALLQEQPFSDVKISKVSASTTTSPIYRAYKIGNVKVSTGGRWVTPTPRGVVRVAKGTYFRVKADLVAADKNARGSVTPTSVQWRRCS